MLNLTFYNAKPTVLKGKTNEKDSIDIPVSKGKCKMYLSPKSKKPYFRFEDDDGKVKWCSLA